MKWIGQQIYDQVSRFRHDFYLEGIAASTETDMLVVDSAGKVSKRAIDAITVDVSDFLTDGANNRVVTATGTDALLAETYFTFENDSNASTLKLISNENALDYFSITTTTNGHTTFETVDADAQGAAMILKADQNIYFKSIAGSYNYYNNHSNTSDYFQIAVGGDGDTKLSTVDAASAAAHFEIEADGNITLDAAGDIALEAGGGDITVDTDNFVIESATSEKPLVTIKATNTTAGMSGELKFLKDAADVEDGEYLGEIGWYGDNNAGSPEEIRYARIFTRISDVTDGSEAGNMFFHVASYDGASTSGLQLIGGTEADGEVDVTIGAGAASTTTIAGNLIVTGTEIYSPGRLRLNPAAGNDILFDGGISLDGDVIENIGTLKLNGVGGTIELGHATDTTIARSAAGVVTIEGDQIITSKPTTVGSGQFGQLGMQIARRTITQAEMNDLHNTPIAIVPALGANLVAIPVNGTIFVDRAANNTVSAQLVIGYGSSTFANSIYFFKRFHYNISTDFHYGMDMYVGNFGTSMTAGVNTAINASADVAYTNNAFTSVDVYINYYVIDRS